MALAIKVEHLELSPYQADGSELIGKHPAEVASNSPIAELDAKRDHLDTGTDGIAWALDLSARFRRALDVAEIIGADNEELERLEAEAKRFKRYVAVQRWLAKMGAAA